MIKKLIILYDIVHSITALEFFVLSFSVFEGVFTSNFPKKLRLSFHEILVFELNTTLLSNIDLFELIKV